METKPITAHPTNPLLTDEETISAHVKNLGLFDDVYTPCHYVNDRKIEPLDAILDWKLDFCLGNVVKYCARAGRKEGEPALTSLKKARVYLDRAIRNLAFTDKS